MYRVPKESETIREVLWTAWHPERDWIPTFDYRLGKDWSGDPAIWVRLVLEDNVAIEAPRTREGLSRLRLLIRARLQEVGIDWWPYVNVCKRSEVNALVARASA